MHCHSVHCHSHRPRFFRCRHSSRQTNATTSSHDLNCLPTCVLSPALLALWFYSPPRCPLSSSLLLSYSPSVPASVRFVAIPHRSVRRSSNLHCRSAGRSATSPEADPYTDRFGDPMLPILPVGLASPRTSTNPAHVHDWRGVFLTDRQADRQADRHREGRHLTLADRQA